MTRSSAVTRAGLGARSRPGDGDTGVRRPETLLCAHRLRRSAAASRALGADTDDRLGNLTENSSAVSGRG
ncbi:hypothetical protein UK82_11430 [Frankia sp. ACN1ag]|nr:hypothetical protein UK82_11430 [Frankia sp. ACN1ag]